MPEFILVLYEFILVSPKMARLILDCLDLHVNQQTDRLPANARSTVRFFLFFFLILFFSYFFLFANVVAACIISLSEKQV
jgi:hypothetical protein